MACNAQERAQVRSAGGTLHVAVVQRASRTSQTLACSGWVMV